MIDKPIPKVDEDVDPTEFLRRLLEISPKDAEEAREQAAKDAQGDDGTHASDAGASRD